MRLRNLSGIVAASYLTTLITVPVVLSKASFPLNARSSYSSESEAIANDTTF